MIDKHKQRYNLVFSGQLLPGTDKERAKRSLAAFFGLTDVTRVAVFFSGNPIALRRNITRDDAQHLYQELRSVGLISEIFSAETPEPKTAKPAPSPQPHIKRHTSTSDASDSALKPPSNVKTGTSESAIESKGSEGAPNFFALRPARHLKTVAQLREGAQLRSGIAAGVALVLCALALTVALLFPAAPGGQEPLGPLAVTTLPGNELVLLLEGALLLHAHSGLPDRRVAASELGFDRLAPPLWAMSNGDIVLNAAASDTKLRLQRCIIDELRCYTFSPDTRQSQVTAIASSLLGDSVFLLEENGQLWRSNTAGEIEAETTVPIPWGQPRIIAREGLLQIPATDGPLLGIYRPDKEGFGEQLDALLILPPAAAANGQDRLLDVALGDTHYWALMAGDDGSTSLFRFDQQWGTPTSVPLPTTGHESFLMTWRDKLLIADIKLSELQRVADDGTVEAPFTSPLLIKERESWLRLYGQRSLLRQFGIGIILMLALLCATTGLLHFASYRFLQITSAQRSALLDPVPTDIQWLTSSKKRDPSIARLGLVLSASASLGLAAAAALGGWQQTLAASPYAIASFYAWGMLRLGSGGYLGLLDEHVIVVDYEGRYFYGERSLTRGNPWLLCAPGATLPLDSRALPNIDTTNVSPKKYLTHSYSPFLEILGALWLSRHPWMRAALALGFGVVLSAGLLGITR